MPVTSRSRVAVPGSFRSARWFALALLGLAASGCELIADFDRSKIPDGRPGRDAGMMRGDASVFPGPDAAIDHDAGTDEDAG